MTTISFQAEVKRLEKIAQEHDDMLAGLIVGAGCNIIILLVFLACVEYL
jgi:hypothetical protein